MACQRCHQKKIKCSGGDSTRSFPCRHCRATRTECVYPTRDRNINVSERYLKGLEHAVRHFTASSAHADSLSREPLEPNHNGPSSSTRRFIEDTTGDAFLVRLRNLTGGSSTWTEGGEDCGTRQEPHQQDSHDGAFPHEYFPLPSDQQVTHTTLKLPPYPYAIHLVEQFETYMGYEYHWYLRKSFHERLDLTYTNPTSDVSKDRTWLCRLLVVLALGETYSNMVAPWIELGNDAIASPNNGTPVAPRPPPGVEFFEEAMSLMKIPFEEATVDHVEILNLMTFYSYSLGRRRSAYVYSGLSMRIASSLMLHTPATSSTLSACDSEHRKRLWWTTYQLDAMTGSELGLNSTYDFEEIEAKLGLPSDDSFLSEDKDQFTPCDLFIAHMRLCSIRSGIFSVASNRLSDAALGQIEALLRPRIDELEKWRQNLPEAVKFDCSFGISPAMINMPECRSLASLYLRFHQCFIILLRPILLRFLTSILTGILGEADQESLVHLCDCCIEMARQNLSILNDLKGINKIAKFGYWESLHLFSSTKVFLMATIINTRRPLSIAYNDSQDNNLYETSKLLLRDMASAGNMTSRGHVHALEELERTRELIVRRTYSDSAEDLGLLDPDFNLDEWLSMLNASPNASMMRM